MLTWLTAALVSITPALPPEGFPTYTGDKGPLPADTTASVRSPHALELKGHRGELPALRIPGPSARAVPRSGSGPLKEVHAFLPYWELDYDAFHWDLLTTLAYFSAEMDSSGTITDDHGWSDEATIGDLRDEAQANGVRFILTITLFSSSAIDTLVGSATNRATAIESIVGAVVTMGGDGANIDFEGVPKSAKANLVTFMQELKAAMTATLGDKAYLTIDTPAVDWNGSFDYDMLADACDGLMIMGYDYHYPGGDPGPNSPLTSGTIWGVHNLTWTIDDYFKYGLAANKGKFILGLPFYGFDWPSTSASIPGTATGKGVAVSYTACKSRAAAAGGFLWDAASLTSYFMENKGGTVHQIWCDDGPSWVEKMALVTQRDIGGIGIWALGYDGATTEYWEAIADAIAPAPVDPGGDVVDSDTSGGAADVVDSDAGTLDTSEPDAGAVVEPEPVVEAEPVVEWEPDADGSADIGERVAADVVVGEADTTGDPIGEDVGVVTADTTNVQDDLYGNVTTILGAASNASGGCDVGARGRSLAGPALLGGIFGLAALVRRRSRAGSPIRS